MKSAKGTVLILGATGGVGKVVVQKCAQVPQVFTNIVGASRDISKYGELNRLLAKPIETYHVDASDKKQLTTLMEKVKPEILVNVGLPYWNLNAMSACLETGTHYLDTACWEPEDEARYRHKEQWDFHYGFKRAGLMAIIGCGFDPGVSNAMVALARQKHFQKIEKVQIWDCNGGSHGKTFASNFNLVINLRELLGQIRYWLKGKWQYTEPLISENAIHHPYDFEEIGERMLYLMYHEELESLAKNFPEIEEMSFWMTFGEQYLRCLRMFVEIGMTSIDRISVPEKSISPLSFLKKIIPNEKLIEKYKQLLSEVGLACETPIFLQTDTISPLEFLQKVLPEPSTLGENYTGKTNIGCIFEGIGLDGKPKRYRIYNICDHAKCYREVSSQAVSYTAGVPAMAGAEMMLTGEWLKPGVYNVEELEPAPFLKAVSDYGLPMKEQFDDKVPQMFNIKAAI